MMKKIIILKHGGGELANQLWNFASIYAYCIEKQIECENYSFFEYSHFFDIPTIKSRVLYSLFFIPFHNHTNRRGTFRTRFFRALYKGYVFLVHIAERGTIISSTNSNNQPFYLPPSQPVNQNFLSIEKNNDVLYFEGWLFRNPEGLKKYREEILRYLTPKETIRQKVESVIVPLRKQFTHVIGVHIRQGDYATFKSGRYILGASRVLEVLKEYLRENATKPEEAVFIITSDGNININDFPGITVLLTNGNAAEDLFTLASTDTIIGSNSSYGNFAAYFGDIPHIVITEEPIDWNYYREKQNYFPTKYCTMVHY